MKLPADKIKLNNDNPRFIRGERFNSLLESLKDFPEMSEAREVIVNKDYVILGGNMRYRAMVEAGWTDIPVRIVDWPEAKQREFIIRDNVYSGDWNYIDLAKNWTIAEAQESGINTDNWVIKEYDSQNEIQDEILNKYNPVCPYCGSENGTANG